MSDPRRRYIYLIAASTPPALSRAPEGLRYRRAPKGRSSAARPARRCRQVSLRSRCRHWRAAFAAFGSAKPVPTDVFRATDSFPKLISFRQPLALPVGEQFQDGGGGLLDRSPRHVELRPIESRAQSPRERDFI